MKQRVSFSSKEQRRDQRRAVSIDGMLDGYQVQIVDLSLSGVGGGAVELLEKQSLGLQEGQYAVLEFRGGDDQRVSLNVEIRRVFEETGEFGAVFHDISTADFDAIESLMFPRRGNGKT
jgi:hypothetical protein